MFPKSTGIRAQLLFYRLFWQLLPRRRRRQVIALQLLALLSALAEVATLATLMPFLRLLAAPRDALPSLGPLASLANTLPSAVLLPSLALSFMLIVVASAFLRVINTIGQFRLAALIYCDLSRLIFHNVINRPYAWHLSRNSSDLINTLTFDVYQITEAVRGILGLVLNIIIAVSLVFTLFFVSPALMLGASVILAALYLCVYRFTHAHIAKSGEILTVNTAKVIKVIQEGIGSIRDVLIDNKQVFFEEAFAESALPLSLAKAKINTLSVSPRYLIEAFVMLLIVGVALVMAMQGQGVEQQLPLLGTFALGAYRLLHPIQNAFACLSQITASRASLFRLWPHLQVSQDELEVISPTSTFMLPLNFKELNLKQVRFRYLSEAPWVLDNVNLTVIHGERLGLVGSTGSGKTTLVDLILGLLEPNEGQILIDGDSLATTPHLRKRWRESIAHVPQQIYLSDATFAENIAFGIPLSCIDWQQLEAAARQARLDQVIESQPNGYHTIVGERGVRLSGGQRQRIAIARALYKNAKLLILDEATSALDNMTEAEVVESIEALENNITVIMIAHRLSTVKRCDRIILLENGRVAAQGSYDYMLKDSHSFRQLVESTERFSTPSS